MDDSNLLIHKLDRDTTIQCLLQLSRSDYGSIAALNKNFRSLIRTGELYQLRQKKGIVEHWIYFSCGALQWEAFDLNLARWMQLPRIIRDDQHFRFCSPKDLFVVGTELLVVGKEQLNPMIYKYSLLTNQWSQGKMMNTPRFSFSSASLGYIGILAGGCDTRYNILSSVELYNSNTGEWKTLPNMNKARKMCSSVFMDGKFYVIGGISTDETKLTCGEEFDMTTEKWRVIPNMFPINNEPDGFFRTPVSLMSPPLIAVVNDVLFAADYTQKEVKKYVKSNNSWVTIGRFPEQITTMNGWGLAFQACGDHLVFIGSPDLDDKDMIEIYAWIPDEGAPQWNLLARKQPGEGSLRSCTVMGC